MKPVIRHTTPRRLLHPASGFLSGYSHTLNPYVGCAFACSYCYVRQMPPALFRGAPWGEWVDVKEGAARQLRRELTNARKKGQVSIFMSSSTDPYQPIEYTEQTTRSMLEVMVEDPPDFLFVQTRSPLVTRDIDLFLSLGSRVRVSVTVETDREDVRKVFSPAAPPIQARLKALARLKEAGVPTQAAAAPLLPCTDQFAAALAEVTNRVVIDDYFMGDGSEGRRTKKLNISELYRKMGLEDWYGPEVYNRIEKQLIGSFPPGHVRVSREGFMP